MIRHAGPLNTACGETFPAARQFVKWGHRREEQPRDCAKVPAAPTSATALELKRNSQKRIDAAAVQHDDFFFEPGVLPVEADPVQVAAACKEHRVAGVHDAHDLEVRGR